MDAPRSRTSHYHWLLVCLLLLITAACASARSAPASGTVTLSWNASGGPDVEGYKIYQATAPGEYGAPIATVSMSLTSYTVTGLESGTTYYFIITAYNSDGSESSFSNEVSKIIL